MFLRSLTGKSNGVANTINFGSQDVNSLSFGINATGSFLNIDYTKLRIKEDDLSFQNSNSNTLSPNMGAGVYFYNERYYLGISIPYFLRTEFFETSSESIVLDKMTYYLIGGYVFNCSEEFKLKPTLLTYASSGSKIKYDLSLNSMWNEKFVLGGSYRLGESLSTMAGFQISSGFFAAYAYDASVNKISGYGSGTHEIMLRFDARGRKSKKKVQPKRFF